MIDELESERKWEKLFSESEDILEKLAYEALAEHAQGKTIPLDIDKLGFSYTTKRFRKLLTGLPKEIHDGVLKRFGSIYKIEPTNVGIVAGSGLQPESKR